MGREKLRSSREQLRFRVRSGVRFEAPSSLMEEETYLSVANFLTKQRLWSEGVEAVKEARGVLIDLEKEEVFIFDPFNWQPEASSFLDHFEPQREFNAALVIGAGEIREIKETIEGLGLALKPQAPIFLFERKPEKVKEAVEPRRELLEDLGLVKREVLIRPSPRKADPINQYLVSRARMPAEWKSGKPINLVDEGPVWRKRWIRKLVKEGASDYRRAGFTPLNAYEIGTRLRQSRFPLDDIGRLKCGFGFGLQAPCGCHWEVDSRGLWTRFLDCGDLDCDGMPHL